MEQISLIDRQRFAPFWSGITAGYLSFPQCRTCSSWHWYPVRLCSSCGADGLEWRRVGGPATLFSWTIVRHAFDPAWSDRLPYLVGMFVFDDAPGVRLISHLIDYDKQQLWVGMRVEPVFPSGKDLEQPTIAFRPSHTG